MQELHSLKNEYKSLDFERKIETQSIIFPVLETS